MTYWKENENLQQLEQSIETRIREMERQLQFGSEQAQEEFELSRSRLQKASKGAIAEIEAMADDAGEELEIVRRRLGELNYLLAEEKLDDGGTLDQLKDRIVEQLDEARTTLREAEATARARFHESEGALEEAWETFHRCLELVRVRLAESASDSAERFEEERQRILQRLREEQTEPGKIEELKQKIREGIEEHKRWIIAFFQSPLEATPHPPEPDYSSTDPKSEKGTAA